MTGASFAVVGGGSWGTAVAGLLAEHHEVVLWAMEQEVVDGVNRDHRNPLFHPEVDLPHGLRATTDVGDAVAGRDAVVMAVPSQYVRDVAGRIDGALSPDVPVVSLAKGIERGTLMRPTEVISEVLGRDSLVGVMCGPNLAVEVVQRRHASTVLAFEDHDVAAWLRPMFATDRFDVYTNDDVIGCEVGGSVKNVVAVATGMATELGHGQNAISALVCRGLVEMTRLGMALGARPETFLGLAGQGDLVATCLSEHSRNHRFGRELAKGRRVEDINADTNMVAEGVKSVDSILQLAQRSGVDMPLAAMVHSVVHEGEDPRAAFEARRRNEPTHELEGVVAFLPPPPPTTTTGEHP